MPEKKLDPELRRIWITVRRAWGIGSPNFTGALSLLKVKQSEKLYDIVKLSLYKDSYVQIIRERPELRQILISDDDRLCMHDIYETLSWKLNRREKPPKSMQLRGKMLPIFNSKS